MITRTQFLETIKEVFPNEDEREDAIAWRVEEDDGSITLIGSDLQEINFRFNNDILVWWE